MERSPLSKLVQGTKSYDMNRPVAVVLFSLIYGCFLEVALLAEDRLEVFAPLFYVVALAQAMLITLLHRVYGAIGVSVTTAIVLSLSLFVGVGHFRAITLFEGLFFVIIFWSLITCLAFVVAIAMGYPERSAALAQSKGGLLERIFDSLPIGIWVRSSSGKTVVVNERWASFSRESIGEIRASDGTSLPVDLGPQWEDTARSIIEDREGGVRYQRIELVDNSGVECELTLLTLGMYVDEDHSLGTLSMLIDETALRSYEEKVRTSESRLRSALDSATVGIWDRDHLRGETYCDENWYSILGEESQTVKIDPLELWESRLHPDDKVRVLDAYVDFFKSRDDTIEIDYRIRLANGEYHWMQDRLGVLEWTGDGRVKRSMGTLLDITERKKVEIVLKDSKERAESANIAKGYFIATISHEIRTPLNAIIGLSSFLTESDLDEEQLDLAKTIYTSGKSLLLLVNDILDFSKIEAGRLDLEMEEYPIRLCLFDCVKLFKLRAAEKEIGLRLELDDSITEFALGDMERLRQVVQNLLANAIKFTDTGEIIVSARRAKLDEIPAERRPNPLDPTGYLDQADHEYVEVIVKDSGIGIPSDRQSELFEAFSQVDSSATRRYEGTGLGLAICKRLVDAMGGRIWVDSEAGKGALFGFVVRTKFMEDVEPLSAMTRTPFEPVAPIAEEHPCDILVVGPLAETERTLLCCRKLGYAPHHSVEYKLDDALFMRRRYGLIFISMSDSAGGFELSRTICTVLTANRPKQIIALVGEQADVSKERCKLVGIERLLEERPTPVILRDLILGALSVNG